LVSYAKSDFAAGNPSKGALKIPTDRINLDSWKHCNTTIG